MEKRKPLKRKMELIPLSHDHHHSLLLCWKIRTGFKNKVNIKRIKGYTDWFFRNHIIPHFELEEQYIFPVLGSEDVKVKQALSDHRRLKRLFEDNDDPTKSLSLLEEELEKHIRFEERILFQEIQYVASEEELKLIAKHHATSNFEENTKDVFWA